MRYQLITITACVIAACGGGEPVPEFMTVDELASTYEKTIGDEIILEGRLSRDLDSEYSLTQLLEDVADSQKEGFRVHIGFPDDNVDHELMNPCVGDATIVTGYVEDGLKIRAKWVKRTADIRTHDFVRCYAHDQ